MSTHVVSAVSMPAGGVSRNHNSSPVSSSTGTDSPTPPQGVLSKPFGGAFFGTPDVRLSNDIGRFRVISTRHLMEVPPPPEFLHVGLGTHYFLARHGEQPYPPLVRLEGFGAETMDVSVVRDDTRPDAAGERLVLDRSLFLVWHKSANVVVQRVQFPLLPIYNVYKEQGRSLAAVLVSVS
ncbi:hypothetical protein FA95DRAFT_1612296 [Auriscalpium vulgare]|uniref:Uncharacterized protein n=1 Tax=Auriscalpium vulgare TaxID=40419 RepID=A0ACB8R875_9AGAM|nr:hypothetical protein FA95DRAFT_1612296 [Auriscalpium vulgare]